MMEIPCLLLIADKGIVSESTAEELQNINSNLQVTMVTDAVHGLHYDQPEQVVTAVKSFLR